VNEKQVGDVLDVDVHFKPRYDPWDQRLCAVPDADLYGALRTGSASMVTDTIDRFTPAGVRLGSGEELEADIVITATGLNLLAFGGIELEVDGTPVHLPGTVAYKTMMLSGVPNFVYAIGYTNASWTLKVDLVCERFCRMLAHADEVGADACVAEVRDADMPLKPLLDFQAGYVLRALDRFPKQGEQEPWLIAMSYAKDAKDLRRGAVDDGTLRFFSAAPAGAAAAAA
jgi:monooxygenase